MQRYARKIRGRVLGKVAFCQYAHLGEPALTAALQLLSVAPNYRLAPQYPFPCALQDLLASCSYCTTFLA